MPVVLLYSKVVGLDPRRIAADDDGLSTSPSQAAALTSVSREKAGMASGALSTMRYIGGVAGSVLAGVVVALPGSPLPLVVFPAAMAASAGVALQLPRRLGEGV